MTFKKILLATAIAAVSTTSFAMEAMDDSSMSDTTGQDGLLITITPPAAGITTDIIWHDTDGYSTRTTAGAVVIDNMSIAIAGAAGNNGIVLDIDASGDVNTGTTGNQAGLRIGVSLQNTTTINTGAISVASSAGVGAAVTDQTATVLSNMTLTIGSGSLAEIFLGNEEDSKSMINLNTSLNSGINVSNFQIADTNSGGNITIGTLDINNAGTGAAGNLGAVVGINATGTGLLATVTTLGAGTGIDVAMTNVALGSATVMGDVEIKGLNLDGTTINIVGK